MTGHYRRGPGEECDSGGCGGQVGSLRAMATSDRYIRRLVSSKTLYPDGSVTTARDLAVWTLAHHGYCGGGRLDV